IFLFSDRLLPSHSPVIAALDQRQVGNYISEITLDKASTLVGRRVTRVFNQIAHASRYATPGPLYGPRRRISNPSHVRNQPAKRGSEVELLGIRRDGVNYLGERSQELSLYEGDVLTVTGTPNAIAHFLSNAQTDPVFTYEDLPLPADGTAQQAANGTQDSAARLKRLRPKAKGKANQERNEAKRVEQQLVEAVLLPESPLNNRRIDEIQAGPLHNTQILGVQHRGRALPRGLAHRRLESGDVLLLQATPGELHAASTAGRLLLIEGVENSILRASKNRLALIIMVWVVLLAALTTTPIVVLALTGATLMVITRCLRVDEAVQSLDSSTLMLLAAAIPLGYAMEYTGLAGAIVNLLLHTVGGASPVIFLSIFYLVANLLAQVISAKAVAVLFAPVALSLATQMGVNPSAMMMAIAFGTAASFLTPMGHQVNAIVMGPGNYTFGDYIRIGLPMTILMWLVATFAIPWIWPL
ncbi:MAG: anion permease, partial [Caldilineaceae bacterium]|nr:anion permease [Caldilineaceae bacterium]